MTKERLQEIRLSAGLLAALGEIHRTDTENDLIELSAAYDELHAQLEVERSANKPLAAEYSEAIRALRKYGHAARVVVAMANGVAPNKRLREAAHEIGIPLRECASVLSTPRAKEVE